MTRRNQQGQTLPIIAICSAVLLGASALAVDLSVATHQRRALQNVTDAAALAGARLLTTVVTSNPAATPSATEQANALTTALDTIPVNMGWSTPPAGGWSAYLSPTCSGGGARCSLSVTLPAPYAGVVITASTPPASMRVTPVWPDTPFDYLEVSVRRPASGGIGGAVGLATGETGRSVAHHRPPGQPFPFALYSGTYVGAQNSSETVSGNVFATTGVDLQENGTGQASICIQRVAASGTGSGGAIVLGPNNIQPTFGSNSYPFQAGPAGPPDPYPNNCITAGGASNVASGAVYQTVNDGAGPCDAAGVAGVWDNGPSGTGGCVSQTMVYPPDFPAPTMTGVGPVVNVTDCSTWTAPHGQGIFVIPSGSCGGNPPADLTLKGTFTLTCVTFVLQDGAQLLVSGNGSSVTQTPFGPGCSGWTGPTPSLNPDDGHIAVYGTGQGDGLTVDKNGDTYHVTGLIDLPAGSVSIGSNGALINDGQTICGSWQDQGGFHPSPVVVWDPTVIPPMPEILRIVE